MDKTYIVAIACEDRNGQFHFVTFSTPVDYDTIIFKEDMLIAGNSVVHYAWYQSITVCTAETIELFKQNLQIAI